MVWASKKSGAVGTSHTSEEITEEQAVTEIERLNKEDVAATRRMLQLAANTQEVANGVSETLQQQGEQIERTREKSQGIQETLRSLAGNMKNAFRWGSKSDSNLAASNYSPSSSPVVSPSYSPAADTAAGAPPPPKPAAGRGRYVQRAADDPADEIDQNLDMINDMLDNLKGQALGIGEELDKQTQMLEQVDEEVNTNVAGTKAATQAVSKPRRWQSELNKVEEKMKAAATTVSTGGLL
mmetsp:Transcript_21449/g.59570  ORF Transcript_21449/g.59570 Transcript_21449/m.59570 type:complete len:239 (+) Transcript_21449:205-921(+)|eukprot:CAMPEP_0117664754 /NCGR_PEP_ID=MMETSP0804-20121206/9407_1 /TAXON_ID=1074897 /ORGANISM="Tetraselmis astigmatica, Strain CCMP880" /LENGTH=238 /DNA_ID=CAMNT_0005472045 /DNA_START=117 /DNA_END=833 /DNA_ORIENTATION=-